MFYTEYRPKKFSELVGIDHIAAAITRALASGNPAHAYFLTGSRGTGKTTTARLLAKALNCQSPLGKESLTTPDLSHIHFEPCGKCPSCVAIQNGNHLDLIEIDAASNRGIDDIRDLRDKVKLSPSMGKKKIYIIDEVHMLTNEASNALLKTLEEPPAHAYFVLCTTNPEKVIETIKSRCQQFQFPRAANENIVAKLQHIVQSRGLDTSQADLQKIAAAAKGAFREAETMLEQFLGDEKFADDLISPRENNLDNFVSQLLSNDRVKAIEIVHKIYADGKNIEKWTEALLEFVRAIMLQKLGVNRVNTGEEASPDLLESLTVENSKKILDRFQQALAEFKWASIITLPLELAIIDVTKACDPIKIQKEMPKLKDTSHKPKTPESALFPYTKLIEKVKPQNHSIHLLLNSCEMTSYDGKNLLLTAHYSFHKERLMSYKVREIVESTASELTGDRVILTCILSDKKPEAKKLTDRNVIASEETAEENVADILEKVFGDNLAS